MKALTLVVICLIVTPIVNAAEGKLTFSTFSFPPFSAVQDNKTVGPFVDIIDAVCQKIRFDCEYQSMPNRRSKQTLKDGTVNGNFPLGWNKDRDGYLWFTIPLMKTEYGFFAKADSTFEYKTLKDLEGMTVSVFGPSNTSHSLQKIREQMKAQGLKPIEIDMHPNADGTGLKKVALGRVQLYYVNRDVGFHRMKQLNISGVRYSGKQKELYYFAGFAKAYNDKAVIDKFNDAARKLSNEGVIAKLLEKYHVDPARWDDDTLAKYDIVIGPR
jgi:polar amino acid transport system substrate-binding protein